MSFNQKRKLKKNVGMFSEQHGIGAVVRSRSGRSRGRLFVVVSAYKDAKGKQYAFVCDSCRYTLSNPKRKSAMHLETVCCTQTERTDILTDEAIKELLEKFS